jgi:hypothetical protein
MQLVTYTSYLFIYLGKRDAAYTSYLYIYLG